MKKSSHCFSEAFLKLFCTGLNVKNTLNMKLHMGKLKVNTWMNICVTEILTYVKKGFTKQKSPPSET